MTTLLEKIKAVQEVQKPKRDFVLGEGVVSPFYSAFGKSDDQFSPPKYGNYIVTSNGVYSCLTLRADLLTSLPVATFREDKDGTRTETRGELFDLLKAVNPFWTFNRLMYMTELSLGLWGKVFWFLERGESGRGAPREIWWGRPDRVAVVPDTKDYIREFVYTPVNGASPIRFSPSEVIWFRRPNPLDEFEGLSPVAAARLAADVASAAMKSNKRNFDSGLLLGGIIKPPPEQVWTDDQAIELEETLDRRFKGVDKAHRWAVMKSDVQVTDKSMSMRDAEYLGGLKWSLADICRAYGVPVDLIGGERTYQNLAEAERAIWIRAIQPQARFLSSEINEQLSPMFSANDLVEFDFSKVAVLQEDQETAWKISNGQIKIGAITINEWREEQGFEDVEWGDQPPLVLTHLAAFKEKTEQDILAAEGVDVDGDDQEDETEEDTDDEDRAIDNRGIELNSEEHVFLWRRHERRLNEYERKFSAVVIDLFRRQTDAVVDRLKAERSKKKKRDESAVAASPFDLDEWIKKFREGVRVVLGFIIADSGMNALDDIGLSIDFDLTDPLYIRFVENRAQKFAERVNQITWEQLQSEIADGIEAGASIPELAEGIESIMGERIRSTPETIARTEVNAATNGGTLISWEQSEVVDLKGWLAALDGRQRETHDAAHLTYQDEPIPLSSNFRVGAGSGPHPGAIGLAEEDINCRCVLTPVINERKYRELTGRKLWGYFPGVPIPHPGDAIVKFDFEKEIVKTLSRMKKLSNGKAA